MNCSNCGAENVGGGSFCGVCGAALTPVKVNLVDEGRSDLENSTNADVGGILACFGGMIGLHEYYRGRRGIAWLRFFLNFTGIGALINVIWLLIDFVKIGRGTWEPSWGPAPWVLFPLKILRLFLILIVVGVVAAVLIPKFFGNISMSKASEIPVTFQTFAVAQKSYASSMGRVGTASEIGFKIPKSSNFSYYEFGGNGEPVGLVAQSTTSLGDCPKGSKWIISAEKRRYGKVNLLCEINSSEKAACEAQTPGFKSACY